MQKLKFTASAACCAVLLSACSSTPTNSASNSSQGTDARAVKTVDASNKNTSGAATRSVYFDFDSYVLKDDGKSVVTANANVLAKQPHKIVVQGNTDERGGAEYNLALGQRRADAVRKSLVLLGVPESQIEAVSFGKEKPKASGHDEAAWTQNRRADIVY
jgi:peptidoglycan-associated lipoprotein